MITKFDTTSLNKHHRLSATHTYTRAPLTGVSDLDCTGCASIRRFLLENRFALFQLDVQFQVKGIQS